MRILNLETDQLVENVIVYLTPREASELASKISDLLINPKKGHAHISDDSYQKEITVCVYYDNNLEGFDERSKNIILNDK